MNTDFPTCKPIVWAHAINNKTLLSLALYSKDYTMIESDIILGSLKGNSCTEVPILGYHPFTTSDLTLDSLLSHVIKYNKDTNRRKGIKLNFKAIEAFEEAVKVIKKHYFEITFPLWLNASVAIGPGGEGTIQKPLDWYRYVTGCSRFPKATISIGWIMNKNMNNREVKSLKYTDQDVRNMLIRVNSTSIGNNPITFPVHAGIAANSLPHILELLKGSKRHSLTVWCGADDYVDCNKLRCLILKAGRHRVYLDIPPGPIYQELHLNDSKIAWQIILCVAIFALTTVYVHKKDDLKLSIKENLIDF